MKLITRYLIKNFLLRLIQILACFSILIFFINFLDVLDKTKDGQASLLIKVTIAFLQTPIFLNDIIESLVLIASIIVFFTLSNRNEITIIRASELSLWKILFPIGMSAFLVGVFWITIFNLISINMTKKFHNLEEKYVRNESREIISLESGIWLKQHNLDNEQEEIIIHAKKIYKDNLEFSDVNFWFFNDQKEFYKKIDTKKMFLVDSNWILEEAIINEDKNLNKNLGKLLIKTDLSKDFIMNQVVHNFQDPKLFSIFELSRIIKDLKRIGFSTIKFEVFLHRQLTLPFLFLSMALIGCYFGVSHNRNRKSLALLFLGIIIGLILYIISSIIVIIGSSGLIPILLSTWVLIIIYLSFGVLLIYNKEHR